MPSPITQPVSYSRRISFLAAEMPDAAAITFEGAATSFRQLDELSNQMARQLQNLGASNGDFVTIAKPNSVEFIVAVVACWKIGAVPQPVSSRLPRFELEAIIELAKPVIVVDAGFELPEGLDASELPDAVSPAWKAPTSGGSTGRPKLIVSGDPSMLVPGFEATAAAVGARAGCTMVMPGPLYHNGPFIWSFQTLLCGGQLVLLPRFDAEGTLAAVQDWKATTMYLVPTMMQRMWKLPDDIKFSYDLTSIERAVHLAEPCPPWLKEVWIDWLGADELWELYGGTEGQCSTMLSGREWLEHRGSVGRPTRGELRIMDEDGNVLGPDETGDVWMRAIDRETPTYHYIGAEPDERDGWETLGDIGWLDAEGYLYLADRRKDMILVGGANVYPAEVEAAIAAHPKVASVAVIGLADQDKGNRVHAIIEPSPDAAGDDGGLTEAELVEFLAERLVVYKIPRTFEYVNEPLRDDAGKVRRSELAAERNVLD